MIKFPSINHIPNLSIFRHFRGITLAGYHDDFIAMGQGAINAQVMIMGNSAQNEKKGHEALSSKQRQQIIDRSLWNVEVCSKLGKNRG